MRGEAHPAAFNRFARLRAKISSALFLSIAVLATATWLRYGSPATTDVSCGPDRTARSTARTYEKKDGAKGAQPRLQRGLLMKAILNHPVLYQAYQNAGGLFGARI